MFCPHCHNKIPAGSNICPLCYSNLAGLKPQSAQAPREAGAQDHAPRKEPQRKSSKKNQAYTKGSRGGKKHVDRTPMIIAFGLIMILLIIIVMIVRSMFGAGDAVVTTTTPPAAQAQATPQGNFIVFGATPAPTQIAAVTATPARGRDAAAGADGAWLSQRRCGRQLRHGYADRRQEIPDG